MARTPERFLNASALAKIASIDPKEFTEKANLFVTAKHAPTVRSHVLLSQVKDSFGETEYARALCTQLVAIATIKRLEAISFEEAIGSIIESMHLNGISEECQGWYKKVEPEILMLLKSSSVRLVAKALHLERFRLCLNREGFPCGPFSDSLPSGGSVHAQPVVPGYSPSFSASS